MLQKVLDHVDDGGRPARRHSMPAPLRIDPFDELGLNPNIDIGLFPFSNVGKVGLCGAVLLDNPGRKIDMRTLLAARLNRQAASRSPR